MPRLSCIALLLALAACNRPPQAAESGSPGNVRHGRTLVAEIGCGSCHSIPGVADAHGRVGPPLDAVAGRMFIAGVLPNTPENMIRWLRTPQSVVPGNAMPNMELTDNDARDIAAFLYTLR